MNFAPAKLISSISFFLLVLVACNHLLYSHIYTSDYMYINIYSFICINVYVVCSLCIMLNSVVYLIAYMYAFVFASLLISTCYCYSLLNEIIVFFILFYPSFLISCLGFLLSSLEAHTRRTHLEIEFDQLPTEMIRESNFSTRKKGLIYILIKQQNWLKIKIR